MFCFHLQKNCIIDWIEVCYFCSSIHSNYQQALCVFCSSLLLWTLYNNKTSHFAIKGFCSEDCWLTFMWTTDGKQKHLWTYDSRSELEQDVRFEAFSTLTLPLPSSTFCSGWEANSNLQASLMYLIRHSSLFTITVQTSVFLPNMLGEAKGFTRKCRPLQISSCSTVFEYITRSALNTRCILNK